MTRSQKTERDSERELSHREREHKLTDHHNTDHQGEEERTVRHTTGVYTLRLGYTQSGYESIVPRLQMLTQSSDIFC